MRSVCARLEKSAPLIDADKVLVVFVDDPTIRELNERFKNVKSATNVLSFEINQTDPEDGRNVLGEIIVSVDTAQREAENAGMPARDRLIELFVHGFVHLLGYDHTAGRQEAARMRRKEQQILHHMNQARQRSGKRA